MEPLTTIDVLCEVVRRNPNMRIAQLGFHKDHPGCLDAFLDRRYQDVVVASGPEFREKLCAHRYLMRNNARWADWRMGMTSLVYDKAGTRLHVPMIDFFERGPDAVSRITSAFTRVIGQAAGGRVLPGYLLFSGLSYHYIGLNLLNEAEWLDLMGLCLLCEDRKGETRSSVVDRRWIGHSLRRGFGMLRIFDDGGRPEPCVVALFS